MTIMRGQHRADGWVAIPNLTVRDTRLSLAAIGLLCHLLSHEPGWKINCDQIARTFGMGRDRTRKAMAELLEHGYALRERYQDTSGRWHTETVIYDMPVDNLFKDLWTTGLPTPENPYVGSSGANRKQSKNEHGVGFKLGDALKVSTKVCGECSGAGQVNDHLNIVVCQPCRGQGLLA